MKNKYGLPEDKLDEIRVRDKTCVYCHKKMIYPFDRKKSNDSATIEHLNDLPPWDNPDTVAFCCGNCNSSRNDKKLLNWFNTLYCTKKNINVETVAGPVKDYIENYEKEKETKRRKRYKV